MHEEEEQQHFISLTAKAFKDMQAQQEQWPANFSLTAVPEADRQAKTLIQPFQQEIVFTLLDSIIEQIRDQHLLILQHCKQKANPSPMGVASRLDDRGRLVIANAPDSQRLCYQSYMFDFITIISTLNYLITHQAILVRSILKHKEGKTFKFLIRNLYFLMTMSVEESSAKKEYACYLEHGLLTKYQVDIAKEFFKRVMLDNPHLTAGERRSKLDARVLFSREVLRNLQDPPRYQLWPQLRTVFAVGAVWLLSVVLKDEDKEDLVQPRSGEDESVQTLIQSMQRYRNVYRQGLTKAIIHESQLHAKGGELQILASIQAVQREIQESIAFFDSQKEPVQYCISALANLLRPFEGSKAVWGEPNSHKVLSLGDLGFVGPQDNPSLRAIDIQEDEDSSDDDLLEDDDEDDDDDDDDEDEDDDMMSDTSQRNMRFSQNNQLEEGQEEDIYGEEDDDEDAGRSHRHHHHHHLLGESDPSSFDDDDDDDDEEQDDDAAAPEELDMIQGLFEAVGDVEEELEMLDYDDEDDSGTVEAAGEEAGEAPGAPEEEEEYDDEYDDSEDESGSVEYDEEYGQEDEDDQADEEIAIGRN